MTCHLTLNRLQKSDGRTSKQIKTKIRVQFSCVTAEAYYQIINGWSRITTKQLEAEIYYYVMINAPIQCLTLNRLQNPDGRTWNQHSKIRKYFGLWILVIHFNFSFYLDWKLLRTDIRLESRFVYFLELKKNYLSLLNCLNLF